MPATPPSRDVETTRRTVRVLALTLLVAACSRAANSASPAPEAPTTVKVVNNDVADMSVFVLSSGQQIRLGIVMGGHTEVFTIPAAIVHFSTQLQFEMRPITTGGRSRTQTTTVSPGEQVRLMILP